MYQARQRQGGDGMEAVSSATLGQYVNRNALNADKKEDLSRRSHLSEQHSFYNKQYHNKPVIQYPLKSVQSLQKLNQSYPLIPMPIQTLESSGKLQPSKASLAKPNVSFGELPSTKSAFYQRSGTSGSALTNVTSKSRLPEQTDHSKTNFSPVKSKLPAKDFQVPDKIKEENLSKLTVLKSGQQSRANGGPTTDLSPVDRQVEGQCRPAEVEKLQSQVHKLQEELEKQAKVNSDLKKLLVASVGDDLHHKVDALVRTKTELASEIGGYTQQMQKDWEAVDQLTIQADMWRSKYLGTRMLLEQMNDKQQHLSGSYTEAVRAVRQLLIERDHLHDAMFYAHRHLKFLVTSYDPAKTSRSSPDIPNILELARTIQLLSENLKCLLMGMLPEPCTELDRPVQNDPSPAEKMAHQVLMKPSSHKTQSTSHTTSVIPRFHLNSKFEGLTFNCCKKCKGELQVV